MQAKKGIWADVPKIVQIWGLGRGIVGFYCY